MRFGILTEKIELRNQFTENDVLFQVTHSKNLYISSFFVLLTWPRTLQFANLKLKLLLFHFSTDFFFKKNNKLEEPNGLEIMRNKALTLWPLQRNIIQSQERFWLKVLNTYFFKKTILKEPKISFSSYIIFFIYIAVFTWESNLEDKIRFGIV